MVGEDLDARAYDEEHEKQVKKMLPSQPRRKAIVVLGRGADAWIMRDELLDSQMVPQVLRHGDAHDQKEEPERDGLQDIVPAFPKPDARNLAPLRRKPLA